MQSTGGGAGGDGGVEGTGGDGGKLATTAGLSRFVWIWDATAQELVDTITGR